MVADHRDAGIVISVTTDTCRMPDGARDDAIDDQLADLERQLSELREEIIEDAVPPTGPFGLPRPPTPGELFRFTGEHAIPAAISVLDAQIKTLELLEEAIHLIDEGREVKTQGEAARDRAAAASRETLNRLEDALTELQRTIEGNGLPTNPEARAILNDIREVTQELDTPGQSTTWQPTDENDGVEIDVESELDAIKDEVDDGDGDEDEP